MATKKPTDSQPERCAICGGALDDEPLFDLNDDIFKTPSPAEFKAKLAELRARPSEPDEFDDIPF